MENIHKHFKLINNTVSEINHKSKTMRTSNHIAHNLVMKHHFDYENKEKK